MKRAGVAPAEIEDVIIGCALQQGSTGGNVARQALLRAGLPVTVPGQSIDRQCSSGLMAIATAAKQIITDGMQVAVGGGVDSISLVQNDKMNRFRAADPWLVKNVPESNGRVGIIGISYDGFLPLMALVDPHPALKVSVPMNPMVDGWIGDDWFHSGAFRQQNMPYVYQQEATRKNEAHWPTTHYDDYDTYLQAGSAGELGRRRGFGTVAMRPHNVPMVLLGAGILWFGWFGFNAGSALSAGSLASSAFVATHLGAAGGMLGWLVPERFRHGRATTIGAVTGAVAGLVAITPASGYVAPLPGLLIGLVAGVVCFAAVQLKERLAFDDSLDVVGVHMVGGIVGALLTGVLFGAAPAWFAGCRRRPWCRSCARPAPGRRPPARSWPCPWPSARASDRGTS